MRAESQHFSSFGVKGGRQIKWPRITQPPLNAFLIVFSFHYGGAEWRKKAVWGRARGAKGNNGEGGCKRTIKKKLIGRASNGRRRPRKAPVSPLLQR